MSYTQKIFLIIGSTFSAIGILISSVFLMILNVAPDGFASFLALPIFFSILGIIFIAGALLSYHKSRQTITSGVRYPAKIYGYVKNKSYTINGSFPVNTIVHYFDRDHIEREVVIPTNFCEGSSTYPIGMTIDIYEYNGRYNFDPSSVRSEILPGEQELMDNKPVEPESCILLQLYVLTAVQATKQLWDMSANVRIVETSIIYNNKNHVTVHT